MTERAQEIRTDIDAIKVSLTDALRHWIMDYRPPGRRLGNEGGRSQPGSRCLLPDWQDEWATYQLYWLKYAKSLPCNWRRAAELYHIAGWTYEDVARELDISPATAKKYRKDAISTVADMLYNSQFHDRQCPRCKGSLMSDAPLTEIEAEYGELNIQCLTCNRSLGQIEAEILEGG